MSYLIYLSAGTGPLLLSPSVSQLIPNFGVSTPPGTGDRSGVGFCSCRGYSSYSGDDGCSI